LGPVIPLTFFSETTLLFVFFVGSVFFVSRVWDLSICARLFFLAPPMKATFEALGETTPHKNVSHDKKRA
jgi:hypothetical protein